ncbi:MAG: response regulator, partial [Proteobacteria bacterium]|nr:response regulator [Pseudomonadota bacterium]
MNLVTNAIEAIVDDGFISITTRNQYIDNITGAELHLDPGEYVVLSVRDNGPGIPLTDREHIFEPFYTRKVMGRSGTGLGLTVVWNTVNDHNGKILVNSNENGTCFQLYFPVTRENSEIHAKSINTEQLSGHGEHILVVDDEAQLRDLACQMLTTLGYNADSVSSGEQAIEFVKKNPVDLIILDMLMEPGINGRQTYEEIAKLIAGQKAIIASGFSESNDVKATLQLGAGGFIKKPYTKAQLGRAVKKELSS